MTLTEALPTRLGQVTNHLRSTYAAKRRPERYVSATNEGPQWLVQSALTINLEQEGGRFIAYLSDIPMFGEGDSDVAAAIDLRRSLAELQLNLSADIEQLAPELEEQLRLLNRYLG